MVERFPSVGAARGADGTPARAGGVRRGGPARERGHSLLEVLVSLLFMAALLLMSMNFMIAGIRGNSRGREMSSASYFAQQMLEEMRLVDFADLADFAGYSTGGPPPGSDPARSICLEWEQGIESELPSGSGDVSVVVSGSLARVVVTVRWVDGVRKERQVRYETMISDRIS
jgi:hypothetical protein